MKKLLLFLMLGIVLISLVSAYQSNTPQDLIFTCKVDNSIPSDSATFNFSIQYPNKTSFIENQQATSKGMGTFNYTLTFPVVGDYDYQLYCFDISGNSSSEGTLQVTSTGKSNSLFFILFIYGLGIVFLFLTTIVDEEFFVYISGLLFLIGGIYLMIYGLEDLNDIWTRMIAFISIGIGMLFTLGAYIYNSYSRSETEEL